MPLFQTILFDLDGTLIDTAHTFEIILNQLRTEQGLTQLSHQEIRRVTPHGANALIALGFGIDKENSNFLQYKQQFLLRYHEFLEHATSPMFPGIEAVINLINAHAIPWGIITNKHKEFTEQVLAGQPLLATASTVISGNTLAVSKPDPAPVLLACEQLAIPTTQAVFIGDHINDIQAGRTAGTATGVALYGYLAPSDQPQIWGADYYFVSPAALYEYLLLNI